MNRHDDQMKTEDDRNKVNTAEATSMVLSVLITVALIGFTAYMGITAPDRPEAHASVVKTEQKADAVHVHVEVTNRGSEGYSEVTVEVDCDEPAPSVTLPNLPASGSKTVILVCPVNTTEPQAKLVSLIPA